MRNKINITFDSPTLQQFFVKGIITKCINQTLLHQHVGIPCEINVLVTNDDTIRTINKSSRNIDAATDVLSFPMFALEADKLPECWDGYIDPDTGLCPLGDMAISLERAVAQAHEYGHSTKREIGYLTIHSVLHLLGFDHVDEAEEKKIMREKEELIAANIAGMSR